MIIYADGAGDGRVALYIMEKTADGKKVPIAVQPEIRQTEAKTHNEAEWEALLYALSEVNIYEEVTIYLDSKNVVHWLDGSYRARDLRMRRYRDKALDYIDERAINVKIFWVRRANNKAGRRLEGGL